MDFVVKRKIKRKIAPFVFTCVCIEKSEKWQKEKCRKSYNCCRLNY
jgi:hypothetical protein